MRIKLLILSIIVAAGFSFADDAVLFGNVLETDLILTPEGVTNAILTTALTEESDPLAYPLATNALALASTALQPGATNGMLRAEADTLATVTARGATTTSAVTIGSRGAGAVGASSFANGFDVVASGYYSHAEGNGTTASGFSSHSSGLNAVASNITAFAWQGTSGDFAEPKYGSHGDGTFNINPVGGLAGLWIGETNLATTLGGYATTGAVAAVRAEVEAAASPKLTMIPAGTTVFSTDTTVQVVPTRGIYNISVIGDSDISFDLSSIDITNNVARWETWIKVFAPGMTVGLPSTNVVQYLETPDLTTTTANELLQVSWQAWMDGTNLMMQGHLYNRNTQMPPPTLAELRTYHYGSPTIEESPDEWFAFDPGTGTITGFNYEVGREDVVIPWEIGGVAVEAIGWSADFSGTPIETLIGPKTVLSVENGAFSDCTSLTSASFPAATSIGDMAFSGCSSLTSVSLPVASSIWVNAFYGCTSLTSVSLPVASSIWDNAFYGCTSLTSASLPSATSIEGNVFYNCGLLTSAIIPAAEAIGDWAFYGCSSLTSMSLPLATSIGDMAFSGCSSLTSVSLPVASSIGESAFESCTSLTSMSLPVASSIGNGAFMFCSSLTSMSLPLATSIGDWAFYGCSSLTSMSLPVASSIGNSVFTSCYSLTSIYFGTSKPTEGTDVFSSVSPDQVTIFYPTGASAWSGTTNWCGMSTAPYTPPAP